MAARYRGILHETLVTRQDVSLRLPLPSFNSPPPSTYLSFNCFLARAGMQILLLEFCEGTIARDVFKRRR